MQVRLTKKTFMQLGSYNYTLRFSGDVKSWWEAESLCQQSGDHLLSLHSDMEMKAIYEIMPETFIMGIYTGLQVRVRFFLM